MYITKVFKNNKGHTTELPLIIAVVLAMIITLYLIASSSLARFNGYQVSEYSAMKQTKGVSINIKNDSISNAGLDLTLVDKKNKIGHYDDWYKIEKFRYMTWTDVDMIRENEKDFYSNSEDLNMSINWEDSYGKLEPGKYRIIKRVKLKDGKNYIYVYNTFIIN